MARPADSPDRRRGSPQPAVEPVLVAGEGSADVDVVVDLLRRDGRHVVPCHDSAALAAMFEETRPAVLVLAFTSVQLCERHYLGLFRTSQSAGQHPHRCVVLCRKEDIPKAYELARRRHFDDYVPFWPLSFDPYRLQMAVLNALDSRRLAGPVEGAERLQDTVTALERVLQDSHHAGTARLDGVRSEMDSMGSRVHEAVVALVDRLVCPDDVGGRAGDGPASSGPDLVRAQLRVIEDTLKGLRSSLEPMGNWMTVSQATQLQAVQEVKAEAALSAHQHPDVVVVEDDDLQREVAASLLRRAGYSCLGASNGEQALRRVETLQPRAVLMDIEMPEMDGVEVTRRIRANPRLAGTRVIMVTANSTHDHVASSLRAGAVDFIAKPLRREVLLAKLKQHGVLPGGDQSGGRDA